MQPFQERIQKAGFRRNTLSSSEPGETYGINLIGHLTREAFFEEIIFAGLWDVQVEALFDVVERVLRTAKRGKV